jgi:hypothetical protein
MRPTIQSGQTSVSPGCAPDRHPTSLPTGESGLICHMPRLSRAVTQEASRPVEQQALGKRVREAAAEQCSRPAAGLVDPDVESDPQPALIRCISDDGVDRYRGRFPVAFLHVTTWWSERNTAPGRRDRSPAYDAVRPQLLPCSGRGRLACCGTGQGRPVGSLPQRPLARGSGAQHPGSAADVLRTGVGRRFSTHPTLVSEANERLPRQHWGNTRSVDGARRASAGPGRRLADIRINRHPSTTVVRRRPLAGGRGAGSNPAGGTQTSTLVATPSAPPVHPDRRCVVRPEAPQISRTCPPSTTSRRVVCTASSIRRSWVTSSSVPA